MLDAGSWQNVHKLKLSGFISRGGWESATKILKVSRSNGLYLLSQIRSMTSVWYGGIWKSKCLSVAVGGVKPIVTYLPWTPLEKLLKKFVSQTTSADEVTLNVFWKRCSYQSTKTKANNPRSTPIWLGHVNYNDSKTIRSVWYYFHQHLYRKRAQDTKNV